MSLVLGPHNAMLRGTAEMDRTPPQMSALEGQGYSVKDFYKEIRKAFDEDENSDVAVFAKIMMATCDFDVFVMLMREQARRLQNKPMQNVSYEDFQDNGVEGKK